MNLRNSLVLITAMVVSGFATSALAEPMDIGEEIPNEATDKRVITQPIIDHVIYFTKIVKCEGQNMAVLYQSIGGYSRGTKFVGTCRPIHKNSVDTCKMDDSEIAKTCYNSAIDFYKLKDRYRKIQVQPTDISQRALDREAPSAPTSGGNVAR